MSAPDFEALLERHFPVFCSDGDYGEHQWIECSCDSEYFVDTDADTATHRAHLAAEIRREMGERLESNGVRLSVRSVLLTQLIAEYGEDEDTWTEMRSLTRITGAVLALVAEEVRGL